MPQKCSVGIIGAGRMAGFHLDVLAVFPDAEVKAIATKGNQGRLEQMSQKYNIPKIYANYLEMLDREKLDAVFIAVSVIDNFMVTKACLERGVPCLIEKPPGLTVEETSELLRLAQEKNVLNMVGLQRRFSSHILEGIRLLKERGPLYSITIEAPERFEEIKAKKKFPEEVLTRWIMNNGIHLLDMFQLIGGNMTSVVTSRTNWKEKLHPDSLHAFLEFENGAVGHYLSNWNSPGGWAIKLYGEGIRIEIAPMEEGRVIFSNGTIRELAVDPIDLKFKHGLYAQDRMFIDAVSGRSEIGYPAATLEEALIAMELAETLLDPSASMRRLGSDPEFLTKG